VDTVDTVDNALQPLYTVAFRLLAGFITIIGSPRAGVHGKKQWSAQACHPIH